MLNFAKWLKHKTEQELINEYLSESTSLIEIESKQRLIDRGEAPWQIQAKYRLKGWL